MDVSKYLDLYLSESAEHLSRMRHSLRANGGPATDDVKELFRSAHSLKGMAASMGFDLAAALAHQLESLLGSWRQGRPATEGQLDAALKALDTMDALLDGTRARGSEPDLKSSVDEALAAIGLSLGPLPDAKEAAPFAAPFPAAKPAPAQPSLPSQAVLSAKAKITVSISPASPLPAARLMVVASRLRQELGPFSMSPDLETIRAQNLKSAVFHVDNISGLKDLARALKELPDVSDVLLELPPEGGTSGYGEPVLVHSVRVQAADLDALLAHASELLYDLNQFEAGLEPLERHRHRFWLEGHRSHLGRLFDDVLGVRLVSFESLVDRVARTGRELSGKLGKPVKFEVSGAEERVDRALLEKLLDPLVHLVRNALDHGLEAPETRAAAGKSREGLVRLEIRREGESLMISLSDDGRGIDVEAIREAAVERGLFDAQEAALLDRAQLLEILTTPAFSTRKEVSEVSGRGVGLDVVRSAAESLGGYLEMESSRDEGTRFTLVIPAAVTLTRVLVFGWGSEVRYAVPTSQIRHIYPLNGYSLVWTGDHHQLEAGDEMLPVLSWRGGPVGKDWLGLRLVGPAGDRVLLVSRIHQAEKVVVLPWGAPLEMMPEWMGGALLSTGEIAYVLDGRAVAKREVEEVHVP